MDHKVAPTKSYKHEIDTNTKMSIEPNVTLIPRSIMECVTLLIIILFVYYSKKRTKNF